MSRYWSRHRLLYTITIGVIMALIISLLFVDPYISEQAAYYNSQSIYKNTSIDFIVPEPSYEQVSQLPGTNGIDSLFPFYLTNTSISANGKSRTTTILLADKKSDIELTMYNRNRLLEKSSIEFDNPILVDQQFSHDMSVKIGDEITFLLGEGPLTYRVSAIYETNTLYDGGAILAQLTDSQMAAIQYQSLNNGYSAMYVSAKDYDLCRQYFTTEYRPLGRLRSEDQFDSHEQYQIHYDAIMSSGYANEITDFRIRKDQQSKSVSSYLIWLGAILAIAFIIAYNVFLSKRGCETTYFHKQCVPNGQDVKPYYIISFVSEIISCLGFYAIVLILVLSLKNDYIPSSVINMKIYVYPIAVIVAELISCTLNTATYRNLHVNADSEKQSSSGCNK